MRVWAPGAKRVELVIGDDAWAMTAAPHGWWSSEQQLAHGTRYWFAVNGERYSDPRSAWQPDGPHGPSCVVDHGAFRWQHERWPLAPWSEAILYELHIGTFTPAGTFAAASERLGYLADLGITHIELMPVVEFMGERGWGYDGVCPYAPHHAYGGPDGLKQLIDAAHGLGLGVILDVVYNHLGPSGNYLPKFGPYFTSHYLTPWGAAINFDGPASDEVRQYFLDNAEMWFREYRCDALRLDAIHAIIDHSATHILEELSQTTSALSAQLGRELILIAESDLNDPRVIRPSQQGGYGMHAQWADDLHHALHAVLTGELQGYYEDFGKVADIAAAWQSPFIYQGQYSTHRQRRHGRVPDGLPPDRFVVSLQNHDQIGNRATGQRITQLISPARAKIGAALYLLSPYVPMLFQGEEWGATTPFQYFVDFTSEPDLARAVREGRQREFARFAWDPASIPDPNDARTFENSQLRWSELELPEHQDLLTWYRQLIRFRGSPEFIASRSEPTRAQFSEENGWLMLNRGSLWAACNFAQEKRSLPWSPQGKPQLVLTSQPGAEFTSAHVHLDGETIALLKTSIG